ncbi:hypothetical protein PoB_001122700 [Plakobranchus ocellatus]|uniref:SMB domain-containing protein n=1 Tax=Plakobranchus ocellatus TaxID=259542 RepID=A0AAV3YP37_9GAST|nr:hypothetical protein PoB_001122700 [Plakobranchus ocellatus]
MEFLRSHNPPGAALRMLITIALLPLLGTSLLPTDVLDSSNSTSGPGAISLATIFMANERDSKNSKNPNELANINRPSFNKSKAQEQTTLLSAFLKVKNDLLIGNTENSLQEPIGRFCNTTSSCMFSDSSSPKEESKIFREVMRGFNSTSHLERFSPLIPRDSPLPPHGFKITDNRSIVSVISQKGTAPSTPTHKHSLNCSIYRNETNCDSTDISPCSYELSSNRKSFENETDNNGTELPILIQEHYMINGSSEKESDNNVTTILISMQECNKNNVNPENETGIEGTEIPMLIQEQHLKHANSNVSPVTATTILDGDNDVALMFSCQGRCGKKFSFPCSCSPTCVVYGTCCFNLTKDCPHVWEIGNSRFDHLRGANFYCDEYVYKIASCPKLDQVHAERKEKGLENARLSIMKTGNRSFTTKNSSDDTASTPGSSMLNGYHSSDSNPRESFIKRLQNAFALAPVTDLDTGFTFKNKAIYDCNNMPESSALPWSLKFDYDFISPTKLEDFDHTKTLNEYQTDLDEQIFADHSCMPNIIETCNQTTHLEMIDEMMYADEYHKSALVLCSEILSEVCYRNKFYAFCNEGRHGRFKLYLKNKMKFKWADFHVLMSLSDPNTFSFRLSNPPSTNALRIRFPWSHAKCSISEKDSFSVTGRTADRESVDSEKRSVCSVTCGDPRFTVRPDGLCKAEHVALLAVADDGLAPLCSSAMTGMARFLVCGLEREVKSLRKADFGTSSVSVMFDSSLNKSLYVVKIKVALPQTSHWVFSSTADDLYINIHHVALLARSLKNYRLSEKLCQEKEKETQNREDLKRIRTLPLNTLTTYLDLENREFHQVMKKLRGPVVDNQTTTTVCVSGLDSHNDLAVDSLACIDDPEYERDAALLNTIRSSPCFSRLENLELPDTNGAIPMTGNYKILLNWVSSLCILLFFFVKVTGNLQI